MNVVRISLIMLLLVCGSCKPLGAADELYCKNRLSIMAGENNSITTSSKPEVTRSLNSSFFSFNLEWVDFQQDLWDAKRMEVKPAVVEWLRPFAGAAYRYPGGTGSNHLKWTDTVGDINMRPVRPRVDWLGPIAPYFGFDEYLEFVDKVGGQPWIVLNIYGDYGREIDSAVLSKEAADWARYAAKRAEEGRPKVLRWELGNELDRGRTLWPPGKYTKISDHVSSAVREAIPKATFVAMLQDWPAQKALTTPEYNRQVMTGLAKRVNEYAHHFYYEEARWNSVMNRMELACQSINNAKKSGIRQPTLWITEHARGTPGERGADWKRHWPKTANLEAALITAEAYIAATQFPEIQGLFLHSLGTTHGPWPLFNSTKTQSIHPSAVYWGLRVLRDSMLPNVLVSRTYSRNNEKSIGDHDVRATILTDETFQKYVVWSVNRYGLSTKLSVNIPALAGRNGSTRFTFIADSNKEANNYASSDRVSPQTQVSTLTFNADGIAVIELPPYSVSSLQINLQ